MGNLQSPWTIAVFLSFAPSSLMHLALGPHTLDGCKWLCQRWSQKAKGMACVEAPVLVKGMRADETYEQAPCVAEPFAYFWRLVYCLHTHCFQLFLKKSSFCEGAGKGPMAAYPLDLTLLFHFSDCTPIIHEVHSCTVCVKLICFCGASCRIQDAKEKVAFLCCTTCLSRIHGFTWTCAIPFHALPWRIIKVEKEQHPLERIYKFGVAATSDSTIHRGRERAPIPMAKLSLSIQTV